MMQQKIEGRFSKLLPRVLAGVVFIPVLVAVGIKGGYATLILIDIFILLALNEYYFIIKAKGKNPVRIMLLAGGLLIPNIIFIEERTGYGYLTTFAITMIISSFIIVEIFRKQETGLHIENIAVSILGILYIAWLGSFFIYARELPHRFAHKYSDGAGYFFLPFFLTWAADTAAYFVGLSIGKTKLLPRVSPGKSVEGAIGGIGGSVMFGFIAKAWFAPYLQWYDCIILGGLVGIFGLLGDLGESLMKRDANIKDTSNLIPGHGGVLDRTDALFLTAPLVYYYLILLNFR